MKPRNKREREVAELSSKLPPIGKAIDWAKEHVFSHTAFKCKDELWCSDCGHVWSYFDEAELVVYVCDDGATICPGCGRKVQIKVNTRKKNDEDTYMTIPNTIGGYQVFRHINVCRFTRKGQDEVHYYFREVVQEWVNVDGKRSIMALPYNTNSTGFCGGELSIKDHRPSYYYGDKYALCGEIYPHGTILPILRKRGLRIDFFNCCPSAISMDLLKGYGDYEYLIKSKQIPLLIHSRKTGRAYVQYKHAINICNRNKYIIKDASMYCDYLDLLAYFGKDLRNAHYVCPKNLKKEHDVLFKRKQKIDAENRRRADEEAKVKAALKRKEDIRRFYEQKMHLLGICITDGRITIQPLQSVTEFYKEWKIMHHCVFTNKYYTREDCLILSARMGDKHIETIEINLKTFEVVQCRGPHNSNTEYHEQIVNLVKKNINLIKQVA